MLKNGFDVAQEAVVTMMWGNLVNVLPTLMNLQRWKLLVPIPDEVFLISPCSELSRAECVGPARAGFGRESVGSSGCMGRRSVPDPVPWEAG